MIILKNITLRNFLSIGAVTQAVNFDSKELTLILGENLDLGGDGARNGTGKNPHSGFVLCVVWLPYQQHSQR